MNRMNRRRARASQPDAVWLAAALREQAQKHEADSGRIGAGFEHLLAAERRPGEPRRTEPRRYAGPARLRLTGVPLGLLAALASAAVAVAVAVFLGLGDGHAARLSSQVAAPPGSRGPASAAPGPNSLSTSSAALPAVTIPPAASPAATPARGAATATRPTGALTASGTVDPHSSQYWIQENLTVTTTRAIRELNVTVTVSGGLTADPTGSWTTILPADVETTVSRVPDGLVYKITLKPGQILQPAAYRFGFQFNRPSGGHSFALDAYHVSAVTAGAAVEFASGRF